MPTGQMQAVGIGGAVTIVIMGLIDQIFPGSIDWSATVSGVPLGAAVVFVGMTVAGWFKGGAK